MLVTDLYYFAKPVIPLRIRLLFRSALAGYLRQKRVDSWPINESAGKIPERWQGWPNGKKFAFVLTHDVEGKRGLGRCNQLAKLEIDLGFRSSFNFVPEGEYRVPDSLRSYLTANGFEVGVHDLHHDGSLYRSYRRFAREAEKINHYLQQWEAEGFRSGFMRHNLQWLDDVNVLYDCSTFDTDPFEPQPDGVDTIFPFWVSRDGRNGFVELPYTLAQDSTLFLLLKETSIDIWRRKLDWVAAKGGLALVNVHPDYISFTGQRKIGEYDHHLYRDLLEYVSSRYRDECWFALPREVARYFYSTSVKGSGVNRCLVGHDEAAEKVQLPERQVPRPSMTSLLQGKRMVAVSFSPFPADPRPRRAAETFIQAGMRVDLICLKDDESPRREMLNGIQIERIPLRHNRGSKVSYIARYCLFIMIAFAKLAVRCMTRRYDIVHIHNMPDVLVFAALVPKLLGAKVILDLHDPMPELMMTIFNLRREDQAVRLMTFLERRSIAFADVILTVNQACEKLFASRSCSATKINVVMNSPDERIFKFTPARITTGASDARRRPFIIMYHGTLVERNGVDLAVEALAGLRKSIPLAELRIYGGRTPFLDQVMSSISERGLEKAVQYLGPRKLEGLVQAVMECDVGVIPNRRNIFTEINTPTRIFEYLALGKPVVVPRSPGIQDYFKDDELIFFDLGDVNDLVRKLYWVASHPAETAEVTIRAQAIYRSHSWQMEKAKLINAAAHLMDSPSSSVESEV
jgi:glycosyltransferase involved in cell wall biosynthesis